MTSFSFRHEGEIILDEGELIFIETADVGFLSAGAGATPFDIIENEKVHRSVVEAVVVRSEVFVKGFV